MSSSNGIFSRRFSSSVDEPSDTEAFEIAVEMSAGEPLTLSDQMIKEHVICSEYALICRDPIDGLYAIPSCADSSIWFGLLFIRRGVYVGAVLRFKLYLPFDFPVTSKIPKVIFDIDVFHPHIDQKTREIDLKRYFSDGWNKDKHHIYHLLLIVQRTFFTFDADPSHCANPEAALILRDNREAFKEKAHEVIRKSRSVIYEPPEEQDANAIRLSPWDASLHEPLRQRLIGGLTDSQISTMSMLGGLGFGPMGASIFDSRGKAGYSWVNANEMTYMVEQPRPPQLELTERSLFGEEQPDSASSYRSSLRGASDGRSSDDARRNSPIEALDLKQLDSPRDGNVDTNSSRMQSIHLSPLSDPQGARDEKPAEETCSPDVVHAAQGDSSDERRGRSSLSSLTDVSLSGSEQRR